MKQNLLFNQASALGMRFIMVLTMLLIVGVGQAWGAEDSYSCTNTSGSTSPITGTSTSGCFTVKFEQNTASSWRSSTEQHWRLYSGSKVTITPESGITISQLVITTTSNDYATAGQNATWTNATATASGSTITVTPTDGNQSVTCVPSAQTRWTKITITYESATPKQKYTLSYQAGEDSGILQVEEGANLLDVLGELETPTSCDATSTTFVGWTATKITEKTNTTPTFITSTGVMPSADFAVFAVFAREETTEGGMTTTTFTAGTDDIATGKNGIKFTMSNTTGSGGYYQVYSGSAMTINSDNPITSFIITCTASGTAKYGPGNITFKTGSYSYLETNGTWTGNSKSVESNNSSAQLRITKIVVTTSGGTTTTYFDYITSCSTETVPSLSASVSSLAFGNVTVNSSEELEFTLSGSNLTADATLALSGTNAGMFSVSPTPVTPSNGSITNQTITVTYTPDAKASHSATLTISSTGAESIEIPLSGTGVAQMANYTVKHYKQNLDGTYPTEPTETEYPSGEVGTNVTPAVKSYEGFTAPSTTEVTIAADGTTVVEYYYTRNSYTLTWDVNEGNDLTGEYTSGSVKFGATITKPADPTRAGYNFSGWHNGTAIVTPATTMPADNLTYTAQWKATYTVTFLNHGEEVEKVTVEAGNPVTLPTEELTSCDTEKYPHFYGWTANPIDGVGTTEPADLITANFTPNNSVTLHAVFVDRLPQAGGWQMVTSTSELVAGKIYTIGSYGSPDSGVAMGTQNSTNRGTANWTTGTPVELTLGGSTGAWTLYDPVEEGYLYAASNSSNHLKTQSTLNDNGKWAITFNSEEANIVAQGSNSHKYMRYNPNNGSPIFSCYEKSSSQSDIFLLTKSMATQPTAFITSCCETEAPTDGSIDGVKGSGNAMSVTLHWKDANDYKRYHVVCDELGIDEYVEEKTDFETNGVLSECTTYIFKVSSAPDPGCESPVLEIEATPFIPKTIAFVDGANTTKQSTTCELPSITVPTPTAQNCSTYVWIDEATGTEYTAGQTIIPTKDMTIVAKWSVITYTITFNDWDGTQLQQSTVECDQTPAYNGETPTRPENNTHKYTFAGWTPTIVPANSEATYTATYTETQHQITVIWMVNGEEYILGDPSTTVSAGEKVAKLPTPPSPDDYCGQVFAGWTDQPIDGAPIADAPAVLFNTPEASPTLYKEGDKTTVTFYAVFADIKE